jgi:hypothetical protein
MNRRKFINRSALSRCSEPVLLWDEANNRFTNSNAANDLITPVYTLPWTLPKFQ